MNKLSVRASLTVLAGAGLLAAILIFGIAQWSFSYLEGQTQKTFVSKDVVADILPPPMYLIEMRLVLSQGVEKSLNPEETEKRFKTLISEYEAREKYWRENPPYGLEKYLLGPQNEFAMQFIRASEEKVIKPLVAGDLEASRQGLEAVHPLYLKHRAAVDDTVKVASAFAEQSIADYTKSDSTSFWAMIGILISMALILWFAFRTSLSSILNPLRECSHLASEVAAGHLDAHIDHSRQDELGHLMRALDEMTNHLKNMLGTVSQSAAQVNSKSSDIAHGTLSLSAQTEEQAAALQATTASIAELTQNVTQSAQSAREATAIGQATSEVAETAGNMVGRIVTTMSDIANSSAKISEIISVINNIAFQTNILALNASVEAARAGEQGRGFAVVAEEVRNLAQRTAVAAREIGTLITDSVTRVKTGTNLVNEAGETMADVVRRVQQMSTLIQEIASSTANQAQSLESINESARCLDTTTQQNSSLVEQTAAAAASLQEEANQLYAGISHFRTN
jgi:methyl-accepting chemotaxis protein I, serine sensor receptor